MSRYYLPIFALICFASAASAVPGADIYSSVAGDSFHKQTVETDTAADAGAADDSMANTSDQAMLGHESTDDNDPGDAGGRTLEKEWPEVDTAGDAGSANTVAVVSFESWDFNGDGDIV